MKNATLLAVFLAAFAASAHAQSYKSAVGLRLGYPASASVKHFLNEKGALEGFVGFRSEEYWRWINVAGLYEHHAPIEGVEGLSWYVGGGAAAYFWSWGDGFLGSDDYSTTTYGILGVGGLDYKFANIPLNLSLDWMPAFFLNGYLSGFGSRYGALSVRYVFKGNDGF